MQNQWIVSPFFLDEALPELELLATSDCVLNKPLLPEQEQQSRMSVIHGPLADLIAEIVNTGKRPVSIAGDCCTTIGVLAGLQRAGLDPTLIWFDAHGDFNTWETTPSGFLGGMPLAMLVGRGEQTMGKAVGLTPLSETRVILTDARDLDIGEQKLLESSVVCHLTNATNLLSHPLPDGPIYIHFDTDIIDPDEAPAMQYVAAGGPSVAELQNIFHHLAQTGQIAAVSMTSWTPELDRDGQSQKACMLLLKTLIR